MFGDAASYLGLFFLLPWIIGFLAFQLLPIILTIFLSFTDYKANVRVCKLETSILSGWTITGAC